MNDDTETAELPPVKRPSHWIDVLIGLIVFLVIVSVCLSSSCGHHHA